MGNIESYVKWRGDLTFAERPFCEVDNLVFSEIAYLDWKGIVPEDEAGGSISLREAAAEFMRLNRAATCAFGPEPDFLLALAGSNRFAEVRLSHFRELLDEEKQLEFAAMRFNLGDMDYIAFRGTSDSLVGWREDFNMSFQRVPAQEQAALYLNDLLAHSQRRLMVGGHSKGGNLAVYAAMLCPPEKQKLIQTIYSNDGPGFCEELIDGENYRAIAPKLVRIVPEFCVVGALFGQESTPKITASSASGLMQHEGMSWQVEGDHFCEKPALAPECCTVNDIFDTWIESASMPERKAFVSDFFDALETNGTKQLSSLSQIGIAELEDILLTLTLGSQKSSKAVAGKLLVSAFTVLRHFDLASLIRSKNAITGAACFVLGLFLMTAPQFSASFMGIGLGAILLFFIARQIVRSATSPHTDLRMFRTKLVAQLCLLCLTAFFTAVFTLVFHIANFIVGVAFLLFAFMQLRAGMRQDCGSKERILRFFVSVLSLMLGIVPMASPGLLLESYGLAAGTMILLYGIANIVYAMYTGEKQKQETAVATR